MRVLVVEDESRLVEIIRKVLEREGFDVTIAVDGDGGLAEALTESYDVIVLDRMLPGRDGLEIVDTLRVRGISTPVLMLTALGELPERIEGLQAGADDYLGKPFALQEMIARVRALARRSAGNYVPDVITRGPLQVDLSAHTVTRDDAPINLSPKEFALLEIFMRNSGRILSRDQLLERVWGYDADPQGNIVELYIHYLRRKLDPAGKDPEPLIRTVRGVGYRFA